MSVGQDVREEQYVDAMLIMELVDGENSIVLLRRSQSRGSTHALRRCELGGIVK